MEIQEGIGWGDFQTHCNVQLEYSGDGEGKRGGYELYHCVQGNAGVEKMTEWAGTGIDIENLIMREGG